MVHDNRYFPWLSHLYTGSDHRHGYFNVDGFFITGGDAYGCESKASREEQIVSYPEIWGELLLDEVGNSMTLAGLNNPIPDDWLWYDRFSTKMNGSLEGQGIAVEGYAPITKRFGIGASAMLLRLNALVTVVPTEDSVKKLFLNSPGNQALFTQVLNEMYQELGITCTSSREIGPGDVVVYARFFDIHEYKFKLRKLDWGVTGGMIIPSGVRRDPNNLASVPFGGNGLWGAFIAPYVEAELKEDMKIGVEGRYTKRFRRLFDGRVPLGKEQILFAPIQGSVGIDPGSTYGISVYAVHEDLRAGFGAQVKYTINYHERDRFTAILDNKDLKPRFASMRRWSSWTSEYLTFRLFYDVAYDKSWQNRPIVSFEWDVPLNQVAGRGVAKTHRVSLGCTVNF